MEVSSAALAMDRLEGVVYQAAAFTNLTQDHLDVHGTMEAYREAKARLFGERLAEVGVAIAMIDDDAGLDMLKRAPRGARRLSVSVLRPGADVNVLEARSTIEGIRARVRTPRGELDVTSRALLGDYNLANIALAVGVADGLGLPHEAIRAGVERLRGVPGRVERVENRRGLDVFVDYAHTPDALERVIAALRPLTKGRLIVVFGCGGDRDRTKRPKMGRIVAEKADLAVVTSDNPRTEEPRSIIDMILEGVKGAGNRPSVVEVDRRLAIGRAVREARAGDVVLIAGKGHEDYQILGKTKIHFDDREEAAKAMDAS
jgi:UDP-N-acetylmuramyl-tripeptide synthetase